MHYFPLVDRLELLDDCWQQSQQLGMVHPLAAAPGFVCLTWPWPGSMFRLAGRQSSQSVAFRAHW